MSVVAIVSYNVLWLFTNATAQGKRTKAVVKTNGHINNASSGERPGNYFRARGEVFRCEREERI